MSVANKSDYKNVRTQIEKLLPAPYQSETNDSLMENTFNRFLTKKETEYVDGYVGKHNTNALYSRQIPEDTIIGQANQLQPIISATLGTEKRYMSWVDVINELEEQGVDMESFGDWGRTEKYNWVPPIDIDKLIHFRDYFWVNPDANSSPEYITIKSVLTEARAKLSTIERIIERFGAEFPITGLNMAAPVQTFSVVNINPSSGWISVSGDVTGIIGDGDYVTIKNTASNNKQIQVVSTTLNGPNTRLNVAPGTFTTTETIGQVQYFQYDGIKVEDDYTLLFEEGFVIFVKNSTNAEINESFLSVTSSELDTDYTVIKLENIFTDSNFSGNISLTEQASIAAGVVACEAGETSTFDLGLWDDNSSTPGIWGGDYTTLLANISNTADPVASGTNGELWFATTSDKLFGYSDVLGTWKVLYNNFSLILDQVTDTALLDFSEPCNTEIPATEKQWSANNFWVHRADVENFATARQANYPIIEFFRGLQINEFLEIKHIWKYRSDNIGMFEVSDTSPVLFELKEFDSFVLSNGDTEIIFDEYYGNVTDTFISGFVFGDDNGNEITTVSSVFRYDTTGDEWNTVVTVSAPVDNTATKYQPVKTSKGDVWTGYNRHWVHGGIAEEVPSATQPRNFLNDITDDTTELNFPPDDQFGNPTGPLVYTYQEGKYAQKFIVADSTNRTFEFASSNLRDKIILDENDLRVYINGTRLYGGYEEIEDTANTGFVAGIELDDDVLLSTLDELVIEIASSTLGDHGMTNLRIRTIEDDFEYGQLPTATRNSLVSAVRYKKIEQIKSSRNQYPQFTIFNTDGSDANTTAPIFEFKIDRDQPIATELGLRVAVDSLNENYTFTQSLIGTSGELYAYAATPTLEFWVNKEAKTVYKNVDGAWTDSFRQGTVFGTAAYSTDAPVVVQDGTVWFDSSTDTVKVYDGGLFVDATSFEISVSDPSISTIWKRSKLPYTPQKKDWHRRTLEEYNNERAIYVASKEESIRFDNPSMTDVEVTNAANEMWLTKQKNSLSPDGEWVGDWTVPDYLFFNPENDNRAEVTSRELVGHFESIINAQDRVAGYLGDRRSQFHVLTQDEVDLGAAGKIHQYNNNFSTFLSSVFVDNIVIPNLFEFAQNQYQILLDNSRDIAISKIEETLLSKPANSDIQADLIAATVAKRSEDSNIEFIYGDTTMFDIATGTGVRNWIATLPNFGIIENVRPSLSIDPSLNRYELVHHDGHRVNYAISASKKNEIIDGLIKFYTTAGNHGIATNSQPSTNFVQLLNDAGNDKELLKQGFYWINTDTRTIYFSCIDFIQDSSVATPTTVPNTFWVDTNTASGELLYSDGNTWTPVSVSNPGDLIDGNTIETSKVSVWKEIDISELVVRTMLDIETRLFEASTKVETKDFSVTSNLEDYFLAYTKATGNEIPFLNTDYNPLDPFTWNYKNSTFGTKYEIVTIDLNANAFVVSGAIANSFQPSSKFYIKNSGENDGTWEVDSASEDTISQTTTIVVVEPITSISTGLLYKGSLPSPNTNTGAESASYWKALYTQFYGTPYPNLEPWKLQGYADKPTWWDSEYKNDDPTVYGDRRWKQLAGVGMWTNIRQGVVPSGYDLPPNTVPQYDYVSVNIGDTVFSTGSVDYQPDDLYPPYLDFNPTGSTLITDNRSLFSNFGFEVNGPADNYTFGDNSKIEYEWRESSQYLYDFAVRAYIESPINFIADTFGFETHTVDGLLIDNKTANVPSYKRTTFHGDIANDSIEKVCGINQWYINYNRYTNVDTNFSDFLQLWTKWSAPLAYRFNSFIDVRTLDIASPQIPVEPNIDYSVFIKKTNGVKSFNINGLSSTLLSIPPKVINHDNSHLWKIQVSNNSTRNNSVPYYGVRNYPFYADVITNTMKIYTYRVVGVDVLRNTVSVDGDLTDIFQNGTVAKFSSGLEIPVFASSFIETKEETVLYFNESVGALTAVELISADINTLPWETGDSVWFTTERKLPAPLFGDTPPIGPIQYFIIKLSDTEFRVAETKRAAQLNIPTVLVNSGTSVHYVGEIVNTFIAGNGDNSSNYWRHYKLDKRVEKVINMPGTINGVQQYIDMVDGYVEKLNEQGFSFSDETFGWQNQIERFIDYSFSVRQRLRNRTIGNRFLVVPDKQTNTWTFAEGFNESPMPAGSAVNLVAKTGNGLPAPFLPKMPYYLIVNNDGTFSLAVSANKASAGIAIKLLDNGSANEIEMYAAVENVTRYPKIEVNTFKDKLTFKPPFGVVSDVITGPFSDINVANSLRDQYGDPLLLSDFTIHRHDESTDIRLTTIKRLDEKRSINEIDDLGREGYHYISAATFYVDTYEHVVEFNNYTNSGNLLYDGFVGLNLQRFNMNFNRPEEKTLRPNIGGSTIISKDRNLITQDNIERMADDLRYAYGSVADNESNRYAPYARSTLGYNENSTEDYLNTININEKSQFLFWQGLIQVKGSTRSIDSFINSKKFVDAKIDEFWAYEVADFGSVEDQEYPQMYINTSDIIDNNAKFEFIEATETAKPGFEISPYGVGGYDITTSSNQVESGEFISVAVNDNVRWYKQPDQAQTLENNGLIMYFESRAVDSIELNLADYVGQSTPTIEHNFKADGVAVVVEFPNVGVERYTVRSTPGVGVGFDDGGTLVKLNTQYVPFVGQTTVFKNGIPMQTPSDYVAVNPLNPNTQTVDEISFVKPLNSTDVIEVSYGPATLNPAIHYDTINSNIIRFKNDSIFALATKITLWNLQSNFEAHNASKLIDVADDSVISNINLFDPARGVYNQQLFNDVDIISSVEPAFFNRTEKFKIQPERESGFVTKQAWAKSEVGKVWLDSSNLSYVPYYDEQIFKDVDDRLQNWGRQADYSSLKVYEWVESDVPPEEYAELVEEEQGNTSIPEYKQKSGTPKRTIFYIERYGAPDFSFGMRELKNEVLNFSAALDGIRYSVDSYGFVLPAEFQQADYFSLGECAIYINGIFDRFEPIDVNATGPKTVTVNGVYESDYVQFVIDYNIDEDLLEQAVEDEIIRITYEYTEVASFTSLGEEVTKYYFWVHDKLTRPQGNDVSAKAIESGWSSVNYPYIVLQQLELAGRVESTLRENFDVDYSFSIDQSHINDSVQYLQIGQTQVDYTAFIDPITSQNLTPGNGAYNPGTGYQPDDVLTLTGGTVIRVISSDGSLSGEVTDFEVIYSGITQPTLGDTLTQTGIVTTSGTPGSGFELMPSTTNLGGFVLSLSSELKSLNGTDPLPVDSSDTFAVSVNGVPLSEKSDTTMSGEYIILDENTVIIAKKVFENDTVSVSYESNKPTRVAELPNRYTRAIVRNIKNFVQEDSRYTIRFRKDFTDDSSMELNNKTLHKEWKLFRQHQQSNIDRYLWDKVTESMIGYKLDDSSVQVPSLSRRLYDTQNNDYTRFGLGEGQTFVDGQQALTTLISDLNDVDNEFRGVDVASFLSLNSFDTPNDIINSMDNIYSNFPTEDVNRIFFLFLNDALSNKTEYAKLLKTSMISVYGVKVLDTQDLFDE